VPRLHQVLSRVLPLLTFYQVRPSLEDRHQQEWALLDTRDHLPDWH
jgi:hypothetical protein